MFVPSHPRLLLATLTAGLSIGSWGFRPLATPPNPALTGMALDRLIAACEDALRARFPADRLVRMAGEPRVEAAVEGTYRLVAAFDAGGTRTAFACHVEQQDGSFEVAALTLVQW
jgi:hypothetical protein